MTHSDPVTPGWRAVGMCWDGDEFDLAGINPWEHEWLSESERIVVAHRATHCNATMWMSG